MKLKINFRLLLLPISFIYSIVAFIRNKLYDLGIKKSWPAVLPTIAIGNLTVGGTGKTPMTILITNILKKEFSVAIASRGYKRKSKECIITHGDHSFDQTGDEPLLMSRKTNVPVAVCADRLRGINMIKKKLSDVQLVVLDDALQHRRLKADVKILLIDYNRPVFNDFFLPAGNLRDNKYRIKEADFIIFTKCPEDLHKRQAQRLIEKTGLAAENVFFTKLTYQNPYNPFNGKTFDLDKLKDYTTLIFSGISNPTPMENFIKYYTKEVVSIRFGDHKNYQLGDLKKIFYNFALLYTERKLMLTTEKDWVKLERLPIPEEYKPYIYVLPVSFTFLFGQENIFNQKILSYGRKLTGKDS